MKLQTIQALRGIAALAVIMGHLRAVGSKYSGEAPILSNYWMNGASGVDLFFVISGFIMVWVAGQAPRGRASAGAFLFARAARIYPLWWLFAGLSVAYYLYAFGTLYNPQHGASGALHLVSSFLLLPQDLFPVLSIGWTLVHEMYFYVAFAGILLLPQRWMVPALILWLVAVIAGSAFATADSSASNLVDLIFHPMTTEFILGACTAYLVRKGWRPFPWLFLVLGTGIFAFSFSQYDFTTSAQAMGWGRVFSFGLPAVLIVYGLVSLEIDRGPFVPRFMVTLGDWSYALYLGHVLTLSGVANLWFPLFGKPGSADNIVFAVLAMIITILAAWFSYRFIERPMIRWFGKQRSNLFGDASANIRPGPIKPRVW